MSPKMNAPNGRNASVSAMEPATAVLLVPNSPAIAVSDMPTRKKSNASSVQPRKLATTAAPWPWPAAAALDAELPPGVGEGIGDRGGAVVDMGRVEVCEGARKLAQRHAGHQ